jgi:hypothetical protein
MLRKSRSLTLALTLGLLAACPAGDDEDGGVKLEADNGVARCAKPVVYLNFGPVTITKGQVDDSRTNVTSAPEIAAAGLTLPEYENAADRQTLTRLIDDFLAQRKIPVVHTRPTSGDYFMLVFVDDFLPGIQGGRTADNCGHTNPNTIGFVNTTFYSLHGSIENSLHGSMLMLGRSVGLDPVDLGLARGNCMINNEFLSTCTFGEVQATKGPCSPANGPQDQMAALDVLACK